MKLDLVGLIALVVVLASCVTLAYLVPDSRAATIGAVLALAGAVTQALRGKVLERQPPPPGVR